jgi:hypothetical protein
MNWIVKALLLTLLIAACAQPPAQRPTVVREQTQVLSQTTREAIQTVQTDGTLVFAGADASRFKTGNIIVSEPGTAMPDGLLRKVTSVEVAGGQTLVRTEQAQIGDAIQKGSLKTGDIELTEADLKSVVPAQGVQIGRISPQADGFKVPINLVLLDKDSNSSTTNDRITAAGELQLKPIISIDLDLDCGFLCLYDNDLDFLAKIGLQETAKLKIAGEALLGTSLKKTFPIATFNFGPKTFFIGPVPVVITPRIVLELKFDGSVGIKVSYEASQTLKAVAGVKYDDGWKNISELDNSFAAGPVGAEAAISGALVAKAKAALRGELMLYGVIGPTIEVAPFIGIDLMYPRDPFWKLSAGIEGNVGVNIKILGYSKSYSTNLWDDSVEIARSENTAPTVKFLNPAAGSSRDLNLCCALQVQLSDPEDGSACCQVSFKSSNALDGVNGVLGNASGSFAELVHNFSSLGSRTITATAVDSKGKTSSASVSFSVINTPPTVAINSPFGNQQFFRGVAYTLRGVSYDPNETGFELPCTGMVWTSSVAADAFPKTGCAVSASFAQNGIRTLTLTGTDTQGSKIAATVSIDVVNPPANLPPVVNLTAPKDGGSYGPDSIIQLAGSATDPEQGAVTLSWDVLTGYNPQTGTGSDQYPVTPAANGDWKPSDSIPYNSGGGCQELNDTLRLRLKARDPQGNEGFDFVVLRIARIC